MKRDDPTASRSATLVALRPQSISGEVLPEKYAKADEQSIGRKLAVPPAEQAHRAELRTLPAGNVPSAATRR